ncbi:MAG: hemolysin-type calcium-binding protein, partial [uncultured bacterium]
AGSRVVQAGEAVGDSFVSVENLQGSNFGDLLVGDAGNNRICGMGGADVLRSGAGADLLSGGAGADTFVFLVGDGRDTVRDFQDNIDTLRISTLAGASMANAAQVGADVVFTLGAGDQVTVLNTTLAAVSDDVIFL